MADTIRPTSELLDLMPTGTPGGVSAQDQRDHVVSSMPNVHYSVEVNSNTTLDGDSDWVFADSSGGTITLTLPLAADSEFQTIRVMKVVAGNTVTIARSGSDTINGATSLNLTSLNSWVDLHSNGSVWRAMG
jgi:hypothetical protein